MHQKYNYFQDQFIPSKHRILQLLNLVFYLLDAKHTEHNIQMFSCVEFPKLLHPHKWQSNIFYTAA